MEDNHYKTTTSKVVFQRYHRGLPSCMQRHPQMAMKTPCLRLWQEMIAPHWFVIENFENIIGM